MPLPGTDRILFGIPGSGSHTIAPLQPLPQITDPVIIDGTLGVFLAAGGSIPMQDSIRGNSIYGNGLLGISLSDNGWANLLTPNDVGEGPNGLQNFPLVTSALALGSQMEVKGSLNSTPSQTFTLDFYSNKQADPSGYGERQTYLGVATVTTDTSGNINFTVSLPVKVTGGRVITATATHSNGNTSEFSAPSAPVVQGGRGHK
jgi:hypothetical protein